jgi:hypothetical protein
LNIKPPRGALVVGVDENGPATAGGIQAGDVLVKFDGQDIKETRDLPRMVTGTAIREVRGEAGASDHAPAWVEFLSRPHDRSRRDHRPFRNPSAMA